jgi:hypothetical protein
MLSVVMLNVVMLNVVMLNVVMLNVIMLNVVMLSVVAPFTPLNRSFPHSSEVQKLDEASARMPYPPLNETRGQCYKTF